MHSDKSIPIRSESISMSSMRNKTAELAYAIIKNRAAPLSLLLLRTTPCPITRADFTFHRRYAYSNIVTSNPTTDPIVRCRTLIEYHVEA